MLEAGVGLLQIRAKTWPADALLALVDALMPVAAHHGATLVVNDRVDVARATGAGVHLGQTDLPVDEARRLLGPAATIGLSTHTRSQLDAAVELPVTYVAFGPVFATGTKAHPDPVVGLDGLREAAARAHAAGRPLVAIGGITLDRAPAVWRAGADSVAVIADLVRDQESPAARAAAFLRQARNVPV